MSGAGPVVALVSGGADSVCLLDVLVAERGVGAVTVLHVDHGLRASAADDAAFVVGRCAALGVRCVVERLGGGGAPDVSGNLQAWARDARYRLAFALAASLDADVATGHTASDQVEGVLYRLAASPGRRALLGMPERDGRLVRPLLAMTRAEVEAHNRARGLEWREDPSNASRAYARNRARADLVPALRQLHPAAEANVLRTLALLRDEAAVLDDVVAEALVQCGFDGVSVDRAGLAALHPALARLVLQALADGAVGGAGPSVGDRLGELLALRGGTKSLDLGGGLRGVVSYDRLRVSHVDARRGPQRAEPLAVPGSTPFLTGAVTAESVSAAGPRHPDVIDPHGRALTLRTRDAGDRVQPLGMRGHHKSLQDLFVDRKVPAADRDAWPVVCAGDEIVWIPGVATAEGARVTDATTGAVRLRWEPGPVA